MIQPGYSEDDARTAEAYGIDIGKRPAPAMEPATLEALKGSIEKWEKIVAGTGQDYGSDNCPLCVMFNITDVDDEDACKGCPVKQATGESGCWGSPYMTMWAEAKEDREFAIAAQAELDFLRSLLPSEIGT